MESRLQFCCRLFEENASSVQRSTYNGNRLDRRLGKCHNTVVISSLCVACVSGPSNTQRQTSPVKSVWNVIGGDLSKLWTVACISRRGGRASAMATVNEAQRRLWGSHWTASHTKIIDRSGPGPGDASRWYKSQQRHGIAARWRHSGVYQKTEREEVREEGRGGGGWNGWNGRCSRRSNSNSCRVWSSFTTSVSSASSNSFDNKWWKTMNTVNSISTLFDDSCEPRACRQM